jgi:hypothetical protein
MNRPDGMVWTAWSKGLRLGVIASSDHVSTHQSYACLYAPQFTPESIHNALKRRLTYAATDNIVVKFEAASADGTLHKMGEEFACKGRPELRIDIQGTAPISKVEVIGNGRILLSRQPGAATDNFRYVDNNPPRGTAYYYVRTVQANGQIAWSSPIWIRAVTKSRP